MTRVLFLTFCLYLSVCDSSVGDDRSELVESLIDAWNQRVLLYRSAEFRWTCQRFTSESVFKALGTGPAKDLRYSEECALSFDGVKFRYGIERGVWSNTQGRLQQSPYLSVSDGKIAKSFWSHPPDSAGPSGTVYREAGSPDILHGLTPAPAMLVCRPFGYGYPGIAIPPDDIRKNCSLVNLNGQASLTIRQQNARRLFQLWVDPSQGFRITRFQVSSGARVTWRCEFEYPPTGNSIVPSRWHLTSLEKNGKILEDYDCRMTYVALNSEISADQFIIDFPVGTIVHDQRTDKSHVVQAGNVHREILPSERSLTYDTLLATKPGEVVERNSYGTRVIVFSACGIVLLITAGMLLRKSRTTTNS